MQTRHPLLSSVDSTLPDGVSPGAAGQKRIRRLVSSSERRRRRQRVAEAQQEALDSLSHFTARSRPSSEEGPLPSPRQIFYPDQDIAKRGLAPDAALDASVDSIRDLNGRDGNGRSLVIACGALGRELVALKKINHWEQLDITCLPASWHNHPEYIPQGVQHKITKAKQQNYHSIFVAYGDCGTGGALDYILRKESVERLEGAHCYAFFTGLEAFDEIQEQEPGTFYLTDYLVRHFDRLVLGHLGIKDHPEMRDLYFGNYKELLYLAQIKSPDLEKMARKAAEGLGLEYHYRFTGFGALNDMPL